MNMHSCFFHPFLLQEACLFDFAAIKWKQQVSTTQSSEPGGRNPGEDDKWVKTASSASREQIKYYKYCFHN